MINDEKSTPQRKRGRPRKTSKAGAGNTVLEKVFPDSGEIDYPIRRDNLGNAEFHKPDEGFLEKCFSRASKMKAFFEYLYRFRGQFCILCLVCLYLLATDVIPRAVWAIDRESPYEFSNVKLGDGYPGQIVSVTATIKEIKPGRSCGVIVNAQLIDADGELAFVSQTRLIAGLALQKSKRDSQGNILLHTKIQVPPTAGTGLAYGIVPLQIICDDNDTHTSRPIKVELTVPWKILPRPDGAPTCGAQALAISQSKAKS